MAYQLDFSISLGSTKTALTLAAQIVDSDGVDVGAAVTTGFTEVGTGTYIWTGSIPDAHQGAVKFYESGIPATILALASVNSAHDETITEDYPAIGATPTHRQMMWMMYSGILTRDLVGTTLKFLKQNGDVAATFNVTLNTGNYPIKMVRLS